MQVLVWSNLDYVMCVHLIDLPPGETGEERAAGNGPAGAGAGLELSSADRRNWRRRGLGSKKKSGLAPRPICHAVGEWVGQSAIVDEWTGLHAVPCCTVW